MPHELHELIRRAQTGDLPAQDALVRAYQARVAGFVRAVSGNCAAVEDIAQATFVKALLQIKKLRDPGHFESWLFRVARNACHDHFRRDRWRKIFVPISATHEEEPADTSRNPCVESEAVAALLHALSKLPPAQRELLALLQEHDWSYDELAAITGSTVSSVKSRLFRARSELKRVLSHD